jgi:hypothetical protein
MIPFHTLVTHPGGAHKDEFLACSVLLALHAVPIFRREPTSEDLSDPAICVLDVGQQHEPTKNNFDHHQLPKDYPPTCSLSLVLQHLGLYEDGRQFCEWLETAEWFDCRGPITTAHHLGVDRDVLSKLISPIDITCLRRFAMASKLEPGNALWEIMKMIGEDLIDYIKSLRQRLNFIGEQAQIWTLNLMGNPAQILFLPRTDPLPDEPSSGLDQYIASRGLTDAIVGLIYPDRRSQGYGMSRFQDNARLDFTQIAGEPDVHFTHARGFIAKTSATEINRLKHLLTLAGVK